MNRVAFVAGDRNRLARQRRLVDGGAGTRYDAVDGNDLARAHQDHVSDRDLIDRNILDRVIGPPVGHARGAIDEGLQVSLSAGDREVLEHIAAGIHDRNDRARQILSKQEGSRHGDECDRVDTHPPGHEIADHRHGQSNDDRDRASGPDPIGQHAATYEPGYGSRVSPVSAITISALRRLRSVMNFAMRFAFAFGGKANDQIRSGPGAHC